jgi:serine/threonine protein kinase/tetratricopeptide (TPR) repeat protein
MDFASGSDLERAAIESHLVACERCRAAVAQLLSQTHSPSRSLSSLARGDRVDRYVILELVGEGSMGRVFAAYDPVLDRKVALKLLRSLDDRPDARARLLREAKALAKVAHPNLVGVHDAGELNTDVFIAMEFVEGQTLRQWLRGSPSRPRVLDAFVQSAQGLLAAHDAGLVHRDFKPDNVLVGRDGRVRVSDFGLARVAAELTPTQPVEPAEQTQPLTASRALVGTPAYMAPEQLRGEPADARSDQFAFAVALYEALDGSRPFERNTAEKVAAGPRVAIGGRVGRVLERALAADPRERFPDLRALLWQLQPPRRQSVALIVAAIAVAVVGGAVVVTRTTGALCLGGEERVANVWTAGRRTELARHFETLGGSATITRASAALDEWTTQWASQHREACEATRVRGVQSDQLLTLRMACLERRLIELDGVLGVLATTDAASLARAGDAVTSMTPLSICANVESLAAPTARPDNPVIVAKVEAVERQLSRARALKDSGRFKEGIPLATSAVLEAHELQWNPLEAEALLLRGELTDGAGEITNAEPMLRDAYRRALMGRADRLAVEAAVSLSFVLSELTRMPDADEWIWHAETIAPRVGKDWELEARIVTQQGHLLFAKSDFAGAEVRYQRAWDLRRDHQGPDHQKTVTMLANLANSKGAQGHFEEAAATMRQAAGSLERSLGRGHHKVGQAYNSVAEQLIALNRPKEALELIDGIFPDQERALDPSSQYLARLHLGRAQALELLGRLDDALDENQKALTVFETAKMALMVAVTTSARGTLLCRTRRLDEGLEAIRKARKRLLEGFGAEHEEYTMTFEREGECLLDAARPKEALGAFQTALDARVKAGGEDDPWSAMAASGLGRTKLALGQRTDAIPLLERAVKLLEQSKIDETVLGKTRSALSVALDPRASTR